MVSETTMVSYEGSKLTTPMCTTVLFPVKLVKQVQVKNRSPLSVAVGKGSCQDEYPCKYQQMIASMYYQQRIN